MCCFLISSNEHCTPFPFHICHPIIFQLPISLPSHFFISYTLHLIFLLFYYTEEIPPPCSLNNVWVPVWRTLWSKRRKPREGETAWEGVQRKPKKIGWLCLSLWFTICLSGLSSSSISREMIDKKNTLKMWEGGEYAAIFKYKNAFVWRFLNLYMDFTAWRYVAEKERRSDQIKGKLNRLKIDLRK